MVETQKRYKFKFNATRKNKRNKKTWGVLLIAVILLVTAIVWRWEAIVEAVPIGDTTVHKYLISNLDSRKCVAYKNMIILCSKSGVAAIDSRGLEKWRINKNIDNPLVATSDNQIAVSSKGGKTIYRISRDGKYEEFLTELPIQNIKISNNGFIIAIVDEKSYNGSVIVYNRMGIPIFRWAAGTFNLIDASLSPDGKKLAVSVIDTINLKVNGSILLFDINTDEKQYAQKSYEDNMISAIKWADNKSIIAVGDKQLSVVDFMANEKWAYKFEDGVLNFFDITENNNIVLVTGGSSIDRRMTVKSFSLGGKKKGEYQYEGNINNISTTGTRILISSMYEAVLIDRYGNQKAIKASEKEIYGGHMFKNGGSVCLDEGGFAEIFLMK